MRRVFAGTTGGPSGILGLVILLPPGVSVARGFSPGVGPPRIRGQASVAGQAEGFRTKAVDEPFRRDSGAVDEPRRSDEPRLRCDREAGVGRRGRLVGPTVYREGRRQPRVGHRPGPSGDRWGRSRPADPRRGLWKRILVAYPRETRSPGRRRGCVSPAPRSGECVRSSRPAGDPLPSERSRETFHKLDPLVRSRHLVLGPLGRPPVGRYVPPTASGSAVLL